MRFERSAGVLLPIPSLPGPCGIGDLGAEAYRFVDFLAASGQSYWQILPLGPNDHGVPYCAESSWAGSPFLISLEQLVADRDLTPEELAAAQVAERSRIDYRAVLSTRETLLGKAAERFARRPEAEREDFKHFCRGEAFWLDDWALFAAVKRHHGGEPWWRWPRPIALKTEAGVREWSEKLAAQIAAQKYLQYRFYQQWDRLRRKTAGSRIKLIGDVPIYCAHDSADVWGAREMFQLDANGMPQAVSGVPPDYFAKDGQLWGHPLYDWKKNEEQGFAWWISRLRGALRHADVVRIDHFRAFESYWAVPARARTAREGKWVEGPGDRFFAAVKKALGDAPFIAEDLGLITRGVRELRDRWQLPGMRVLQFAFAEGAASLHLPIHHVRNCVVYTGTHDNDTATGWYQSATERERDVYRRFTSTDGSFVHYHLARLAYASVADLAVLPMQDVLGLGTWARTNVPSVPEGNWSWKLTRDQVGEEQARMLLGLAETYGRLPGSGRREDEEPEARPGERARESTGA